jgi:hypothetical protein
MRTIFKIIFSFVAAFPVSLWAEQSKICSDFRNLGWPITAKLTRYALHSTVKVGAREDAAQHFYNTDIDGDDIEDEVGLSCSANTIPSEPCLLEAKLSSGDSIEFEAWRLFLVRHRGLIYAVTENDEGKDNNIYRVGPKIMELVCSIE